MIIKKAQFNFADVWDDSLPGWKDNHTRVRIVKTEFGKKAIHVEGKMLPKIKYVEIAKSV